MECFHHLRLALSLPALDPLRDIPGQVLHRHEVVVSLFIGGCMLVAGDVHLLHQKHLWNLCEEKHGAADPSNQGKLLQYQDGQA